MRGIYMYIYSLLFFLFYYLYVTLHGYLILYSRKTETEMIIILNIYTIYQVEVLIVKKL